MKRYFAFLVSLLVVVLHPFPVSAEPPLVAPFDQTQQFLFHAILDGCFQDGLSKEDVSQILLWKKGEGYVHFVYACPICTPAIYAFDVYRSHPDHIYGLKPTSSTFGSGLTPELKNELYSAKPEERLTAINQLIHGWVTDRMNLLRLTDSEKKDLQDKLADLRKKGNDYLLHMKNSEPEKFQMSAFANVKQCAVCNGACSLDLKIDEGK